MDRLTANRFYIAMFLFFLAALAAGSAVFFIGMRENSYLVSDGAGYTVQFLNKPRYDSHLQGLIFSLSFLAAGMLLTVVILLPNTAQGGMTRIAAPPQPRQRPARPGAAAQPAARPEPQPVAQAAAPEPEPAQAQAPAPEPAPVAEVGPEPAPALPPPPAAPKPASLSVEEEVLQSGSPDDLPELERPDARFDDAGEDNVVYGSGRITDDAIWEFVQSHPDSAVKFLYRKTLDNKTLPTSEEDIYRRWEQRGMNRAKIREVVLEIMKWKSLPDDFPHNIWRELRDEIFEMRSR